MVKIIENYTLHEQIGAGEYGKVFRGIDSRNSREVAVKVVSVKRFKENPKLQECTLNEIQILTKINCPQIVTFIQILKTVNNFYFFYEFCNGGTLEQDIIKNGFLQEHKVMEYLEQLLEAFKILTAKNIMHRDLKPSNILIHNGKLKLGDFGFCKGLENQRDLAQTMLGSPIYMAPEVLKGEIYTIKADIWSLGVVVYEMAFGFCPFQQNSIAKLINVLDHQEVSIKREINPISQNLQNLLKKCLIKDHFKRISWNQLFKYPLRLDKPQRQSFNPPHHRALSEYNRIPKRDSDLTFDKSKRPEEMKFLKKKQPDDDLQSEQLHQQLLEMVKIIHKCVNHNSQPEITLYIALKCYKLIEREHTKLGSKYLKERVDLTQAVIQIQTILEQEKNYNDETILRLVQQKMSQRECEALNKILKLTDQKEKHTISQFWLRNLQRQFSQASLLPTF